ncbi:sulfite exporter TauE/SafE family protein [Rhodovulum sp. DZ06]|uniref:sulfite exporter TauE/SafE family protein n=1 Tax=Rhodovulum sp. DZ06 TaxID=3425126 RepID=UPI003D33ED75
MLSQLDLIFLLAAFVVGLSKGGLASAGSLAAPFLALWVDPLRAAALLLPIFIVSDMAALWMFRRDFSRPNVAVLLPAALLGVVVATLAAPHVSVAFTTLLCGGIGIASVAQAAVRALRRGGTQARPFDAPRGAFWGVLVGITSYISHSGAPPFQSFVLPQRLPNLQFAGTAVLVFAGVNLSKLPAYWAAGVMEIPSLRLLAMMGAVAIAGTMVGRQVTKRLSPESYMRIVQALLLVVSVQLVWKGLAEL